MDKQQLKQIIDRCHQRGQRVAVHFCSHVPEEVLTAAGFAVIRLTHLEDVADISPRALPGNLCPVVKECYSICEDPVLEDVDLILTESSCDGKKKMYELITPQEKLWYYQVAQGSDRAYVAPLIRSELGYLIRMLQDRFGAQVTEEGLREAARQANAERESVMELMALQMAEPPAVWGAQLYEAWRTAQANPTCEERTAAYRQQRERLASAEHTVPADAKRILLTGCPLGGVYRKVLQAVEENDGVVVCFENCELAKSSVRHTDTEAEDLVGALAECYRNTACAIMAPNDLRFALLLRLAKEYRVDGILDLTLQTCHAYTVERDKLSRFCRQHDLPYMAVETSAGDSDVGQLKTRIAAFLEML